MFRLSVLLTIGLAVSALGNGMYRGRASSERSYNANTLANDVSLVQTASFITYTAAVQPIGLGTNFVTGGGAVASGWGQLGANVGIPNHLQFLNTQIITLADCRNRHTTANANRVFDHTVCTLSPNGQGLCMGDSGGPLAQGGVVHGIVSWGIPCGLGMPDVFARVSSFVGWINANAGLKVAAVLILAFLAVVVSGELATNDPKYQQWKGRIVGGRYAQDGDFPYQASFRTATGDMHICGGAVLNQQWVITAASCMFGRTTTDTRVVVGAYRLSQGGFNLGLRRIIIHPNFADATLANDVAVVRVSSLMVLSDAVQGVQLGSYYVNVAYGALVSGWGRIEFSNPQFPDNLQYIAVNVISQLECRARFAAPYDARIYDSTLCSSSPIGQGTCLGDAGSPLVHGAELHGIVSWGIPCGEGYPDVIQARAYRVRLLSDVIRTHADTLNDVAIVRTRWSFQFNTLVFPVQMAREYTPANRAVLASGWGMTMLGMPKPADHLQYVALRTISNEECTQRFTNLKNREVSPSNICTYSRTAQGTCMGDSGGPLVSDGELVGLVSWGIPCAVGYPDVVRSVFAPSTMARVQQAVLVLSALLVATSAIGVPDRRIVGGIDAVAGDAPWMVSLRNSINSHLCGGTLLSNRFVLSSANCLSGRIATATMAVAGTRFLNTAAVPYWGLQIITHPNYNVNTLENDVALFQTALPLLLTQSIQPLALSADVIGVGVRARVFGWGSTQTNGGNSNALQFLNVNTLSNDECASFLGAEGWRIGSSSLCTLTREGQGICGGDEGGALVLDNYAIGVVSWGVPCAVGRPDVFTRISSVRSWILNFV
uniref:Peptidase S1 domain-containing protein n=1 Tax=Anopheles dirus TaxID=7168 RepID=A0A182N2T7_9DIPT